MVVIEDVNVIGVNKGNVVEMCSVLLQSFFTEKIRTLLRVRIFALVGLAGFEPTTP